MTSSAIDCPTPSKAGSPVRFSNGMIATESA